MQWIQELFRPHSLENSRRLRLEAGATFPSLAIFRAVVAKVSNLAGYPHIKSNNTHRGKRATLQCPAKHIDTSGLMGPPSGVPCAFYVRAVCLASGCCVVKVCELEHTCDGDGAIGANNTVAATRNSSVPLSVYVEYAQLLVMEERRRCCKFTANSMVQLVARAGVSSCMSLAVAGRAMRRARKCVSTEEPLVPPTRGKRGKRGDEDAAPAPPAKRARLCPSVPRPNTVRHVLSALMTTHAIDAPGGWLHDRELTSGTCQLMDAIVNALVSKQTVASKGAAAKEHTVALYPIQVNVGAPLGYTTPAFFASITNIDITTTICLRKQLSVAVVFAMLTYVCVLRTMYITLTPLVVQVHHSWRGP